MDNDEAVPDTGASESLEIKEWQAIINYLKSLPTKNPQGLTVLALDEHTHENRSVDIVRGR